MVWDGPATLQKNHRLKDRIRNGDDQTPAIDSALSRLDLGDLCLILIDRIDELLAHIAKRIAEG